MKTRINMEPERNKRIQEAVEQTLKAHTRLESDPFFYQKLKVRMETELLEPQAGNFRLAWIRPVAAAAFMILSIGYSLSVMLRSSPMPTTTSGQSDLVQELAEEFYVDESSGQDRWYY